MQRGYSLIELSIAMAILSVVIVGSLVGVQRILANNNANNVLQSIPKFNAALIAGLSNSRGSTAVTTVLANQLGAFPKTIVSGTAAVPVISNAFGGVYTISGNKVIVGASPVGSGYFVHITNVPASVCPTLVNGLSTLTNGIWVSDATGLPTPAVDVSTFDTPTAGNVQPVNGVVDVAKMGTQCSAGDGRTLVAFIPLT